MDHLLDTLGPGKIPTTFVSGEGALLWDEQGHTTWDFYGGHAVTLIGQGHPKWVAALTEQAKQLSFVTTLCDVPVRRRAAEKLCAFTGMDRVFFVNSGAEANEAALKVARKATGRHVIVAMENGFHGRTMGSVGVSHHYRGQHSPAHGEVRFVPFGDEAAVRAALDSDVAAVMLEPVQGLAGIVLPPPGWLAHVAAACRENGSMLIADEVQSGSGRMGVPLACHLSGVLPDLVTVGKAAAATVKPGEQGTTFGGGPLAAAAVEATLRIIEEEGLMARARALGERMSEVLRVPGVVNVRGAGAWAAVVLDRPAKPVAGALLERGFMVGTATDPTVLRLAPPAVTPLYAVDLLADALREILAGNRVQAA
jgi:acetylornithine/N-succinyldiaminopimelate aminotransferase